VRRGGPIAAALFALAAGLLLGRGPAVVEVAPGTSVTDVARASPGAIVRLLPGRHEPFTLHHAVTVVGAPGSEVGGGIRVLADRVRLVDLSVVGGDNGVTVREADGVSLSRVSIRGVELHGIEVVDAHAVIEGCAIHGLTSPYGQGIEIRNANGRPRTVVRGCTVASGQEGLVSHVSRVEFLDNVVTGTSMRAISITEMSEGLAAGNLVHEVSGNALYCGDMSHCEFRDNVARGVAADPGGVRSLGGHGAVAWYYSTMRLQRDAFEGAGSASVVSHGSITTETSPFTYWPQGWTGALPGVQVSAISLGALALVRLAVVGVRRRRGRGREPSEPGRGRLERVARILPDGAIGVLAAGLVVQSFHMLEHVVQVYQVYVADAEIRSGVLGRRADTEWVHFVYNLAVLALMAWATALLLRRRGGRRAPAAGALGSAIAWLLAATLVQAYHFAEHTAKIVQHVAQGVDPAPGLIGARLGLVWFHFGINLAVYAGFALAVVPLLRPALAGALGRARGWLESGGVPEGMSLERTR
jgi:nitrous oxidase accessory protein NosD